MSRMRFPFRIVRTERLRDLEADAAAYRDEFEPRGADAIHFLERMRDGNWLDVEVQRGSTESWREAVEKRASEYPAS